MVPGRKQDQFLHSRVFTNIDEQKKKEINFIHYKEYDFIEPNQTIVTIEHCDNCDTHGISTRHDPAKYAMLA